MILKTKNAIIPDAEINTIIGSPLLTLKINMIEFVDSGEGLLSKKVMNFGLESENPLKFSLLTGFAKFISEIEKSNLDNDKTFLNKLMSADECTYVYWGCGSCGDNHCRVDVYCNSSGGSTPDYSYCELCC